MKYALSHALRRCALALALCLSLTPAAALAEAITTYDGLLAAADAAQDGDVLELSGVIVAGAAPLSAPRRIVLRPAQGGSAEIKGLQLDDADVAFDGLTLSGGLRVSGESYVDLTGDTFVRGASGQTAVSFEGNGSLTVERGASVQGGAGASAVCVRAEGGDVHVAVYGALQGGGGDGDGGSGLQLENLAGDSTVVVSGEVSGGSGLGIGGNAINLYSFGGEASAVLAGVARGGSGRVGGSGVQIVGLSGSASVALSGSVSGAGGEDFGGDSLVVMSAQAGASVSVAGQLTAGNVPDTGERPGAALRIVDEESGQRVSIQGAQLRDGEIIPLGAATATPAPTATPQPTPVPGITASVPVHTLAPSPSPAPTQTPEATPEPSEVPEPTPALSAEPTQNPATPSEANNG